MPWFVYILRCADDTLYAGITTELERRLHEHNHEPLGARYTRSRRPVTLAYAEEHPTRSAAAKREAALKKLDRSSKLELVAPTTGRIARLRSSAESVIPPDRPESAASPKNTQRKCKSSRV